MAAQFKSGRVNDARATQLLLPSTRRTPARIRLPTRAHPIAKSCTKSKLELDHTSQAHTTTELRRSHPRRNHLLPSASSSTFNLTSAAAIAVAGGEQ
uniref:Uncharacterized protein n=1 Tax=Leersia perrieri TaxID=77586 RepID=A0A0D9VLD6_9ORYZ